MKVTQLSSTRPCAPAHCRPSVDRTPSTSASMHRNVSTAAHAKPSRRLLLGAGAVLMASEGAYEVQAVQGLTAGRIPGLSPDPEAEGINIYQRPAGKSGGHGVGWSEIPQYSFRVAEGWQETPVSIADLGGTEIDLRFKNRDEGEASVIVAPVLRFRDVGYNADVNMEFLGPPSKIIAGFAPELFGSPLNDGDVIDTKVYDKGGMTYYQWSLKPHRYVTATATGNRIFLVATSANSRQFRKGAANLQLIADSFTVPPAKNYSTGF